MKAKSAFIRSYCTAELYAVSCINLNLSVVIYPRNTELNLSFRFDESFKKSFFTELFLICFNYNTKRFKNLFYCLMEFRFCRVFLHN